MARCRVFLREHVGVLCWLMSLCLVLGGTATVAVYKNTGVAYDETGIGSNYGDVVASMTKCSPDHPVVTQDTYLYTNFWDVSASCPAYYFIYSPVFSRTGDEVADYGIDAPWHGSDRRLHNLDELADKGVTEFTYLARDSRTAASASHYVVISSMNLPAYGTMYQYRARS